MAHHNLKLFNRYFQDVVNCRKKSEVRFNDRDYKVGDTVTLKEGQLEAGEFVYSGREVSAQISFVDDFGVNDGYVSLSLSRVGMMIIK